MWRAMLREPLMVPEEDSNASQRPQIQPPGLWSGGLIPLLRTQTNVHTIPPGKAQPEYAGPILGLIIPKATPGVPDAGSACPRAQ